MVLNVNNVLYPHALRAQFQIFGYYAKIQTIMKKMQRVELEKIPSSMLYCYGNVI